MYPREYFDTFWRNEILNVVFVAMPFHSEFHGIWTEIIKPGIEGNGKYDLTAYRVDSTNLSGSILTSIFDGVAHSRLFLADISECQEDRWRGQRNGNVMYEVGLAHAIRHSSEVILIRSDEKAINFDIMAINIHKYDRNDYQKSRNLISKIIRDSVDNIEFVKSLTIDRVIARLSPPVLDNLKKFGNSPGYSIRTPRNMGDHLCSINEYNALQFLIEENLVRHDPNTSSGDNNFYKWTDFGVKVLKNLNIR